MSAEILEFSSILRPQVPSAIEEACLDTFCKALLCAGSLPDTSAPRPTDSAP
jgi:hypothetical protein